MGLSVCSWTQWTHDFFSFALLLYAVLSAKSRDKHILFCLPSVKFYAILSLPDFSEPRAKEVGAMAAVISFVLSVFAGIVSNGISKWLDDQFKPGKH